MSIERLKFAILTPTYHRSDTYLPECIESVRKQPDEVDGVPIEYEHHIVNMDPEDKAAMAYLNEQAAEDAHIHAVQASYDGGPVYGCALAYRNYSKNAGARRVQGNPIASHAIPLDDDDVMAPEALAAYGAALIDNPKLELIFGRVAFIDEHGQQTDESHGIDYNNVDYTEDSDEFLRRMLQSNQIPHYAAVGTLAVALAGGWDASFNCNDWPLYVQLICTGAAYRMISDVTENVRIHSGQLTVQHIADGSWDADGHLLNQDYDLAGRRLYEEYAGRYPRTLLLSSYEHANGILLD